MTAAISPRSTADAFALARQRVGVYIDKAGAPPAIGGKLRAIVLAAILQGLPIDDRALDRIGRECIRKYIDGALVENRRSA